MHNIHNVDYYSFLLRQAWQMNDVITNISQIQLLHAWHGPVKAMVLTAILPKASGSSPLDPTGGPWQPQPLAGSIPWCSAPRFRGACQATMVPPFSFHWPTCWGYPRATIDRPSFIHFQKGCAPLYYAKEREHTSEPNTIIKKRNNLSLTVGGTRSWMFEDI